MPEHFCDFKKTDYRLHCLTLRVIVRERGTGRQSMVGVEPVVQQKLAGLGASLRLRVAAADPFPNCSSYCGNTGRSADLLHDKLELPVFSGKPRLRILPRHQTFTVNIFVVSLPRMSMTLTRTRYSPWLSYVFEAEVASFGFSAVRYSCHSL